MNAATSRADKDGSTARRQGGPRLDAAQASPQARKLAAVILEVLAGLRGPAEAASAAGVSLPRYYAAELRALAGMLQACEPRPRGRQVSAAGELQAARQECQRLQ